MLGRLYRGPLPTQRTSALTARRELKMAKSAHAYVRGSTARFYEWIASPAGNKVPRGPDAWICGDCHLGNLGPIGHKEAIACYAVAQLKKL